MLIKNYFKPNLSVINAGSAVCTASWLSKNAAGSKVRSFAFGAFSIGLTLLGTRLPLECSLSVICFECA